MEGNERSKAQNEKKQTRKKQILEKEKIANLKWQWEF